MNFGRNAAPVSRDPQGGARDPGAGATASMIDVHVGRRIRTRREALGVSQGSLGRHLGLTFSQVQKYEKGTNRIGAGRLHLLAGLLGVPVQYFFDGLGEAPVQRGGEARAAETRVEAAILQDAFQAIGNRDTRRSLVSLVACLADAETEPPA